MDRSSPRGLATLSACACVIVSIAGLAVAGTPDQTTQIQPDPPVMEILDPKEEGATAEESRMVQTITYQGRLRQNGVLANGNYNINFGLYANPIGGVSIANSGVMVVSVSQGVFTVDLPFGANLFDGSDRWLELTVNGNVLTPRQRINPTPLAFTSDRLE